MFREIAATVMILVPQKGDWGSPPTAPHILPDDVSEDQGQTSSPFSNPCRRHTGSDLNPSFLSQYWSPPLVLCGVLWPICSWVREDVQCSIKLDCKHIQSFSLQRVLRLRFREKVVGPLFPLQLQDIVMLSIHFHERGMYFGLMGSSFIKLIFLSLNTYASSVVVCYQLGPTGGRKWSDFHFTLSMCKKHKVCSLSLILAISKAMGIQM